MVALINPIRKALPPGLTLTRAYGRGMVWWYVGKDGETIRGRANAKKVIRALTESFETWRWSKEPPKFTYYYFVSRDKKGSLLGVGRVRLPDRGEGVCVLIDELSITTEKELDNFHKRKLAECNAEAPATYDRVG